MTFDVIPENTIYDFLENCYSAKQYHLAITLTDGVTIYGKLSVLTNWVDDGHIKLYGNTADYDYEMLVPLNQIAGIHIPSRYEQERSEKATAISRESFAENLLEDSHSKAREHSFRATRDWARYSMHMPESFDWGNITFSDDSPVFADWDYLQRSSGGINNIGIGFSVASISAGWDNSLWSLFRKKVTQKQVDINSTCSRKEVVLQGFISFINHSSDNAKEIKAEQLEIEGKQWIAASISSQRVLTARRLKKVDWALAYFCLDGFMFPSELWEKFAQPIKIFAEVVPTSVKTEMGTKNCWLKVRCGAYMKTTEVV